MRKRLVPIAACAAALLAACAAGTRAPAGDDARWCDLVVEIATRHGYMRDRAYPATPPTPAMQKGIVTDTLAREQEFLATTPPEIRAAVGAELALYRRWSAWAATHGWDAQPGPDFPQPTPEEARLIRSLVPFQRGRCGITFPPGA